MLLIFQLKNFFGNEDNDLNKDNLPFSKEAIKTENYDNNKYNKITNKIFSDDINFKEI